MARFSLVVVLIAAALTILQPAVRAADPPGEAKSISAGAQELIGQLGDPSFAVRQRATKRLLDLGISAEAELTKALESEDAEVRFRAAQVLGQVTDADFRARLEAFANDPEGRQAHSLPSWDRFSEVFGDDKASRAIFVEMQRAEPGLLESLAASGKLAGELFTVRVQSITQWLMWPQVNGGSPAVTPLGTVCTLLFVSSSNDVAVGDQDAIHLYNLIHQSSFQTSLRSGPNAPVLKKMLGQWIVHNSSSAVAYQNLMLAFNFDLKEGLDLAIKMIGNDGGQPFIRQYVILAIGRFGNHEHIPLIEPLLKDATPCMPQQNDPKQSQIRDVALAVLIHLSGQELKDYGLGHVQANSQMLFQPGTISFPDSSKRDIALEKWQQWAGGKQSSSAPVEKTE